MARKDKISRKKKKRLKSADGTAEEFPAVADDPDPPASSVPGESVVHEEKPAAEETDRVEPSGGQIVEETAKGAVPPQPRARKFPAVEIIILLLAGLALYIGTLDHTFHFDDKQNIWNDPFIQISSLSLDELKTVLAESNLKSRPVANITVALNYYFNGLDVRGYHVFNILVHLLPANDWHITPGHDGSKGGNVSCHGLRPNRPLCRLLSNNIIFIGLILWTFIQFWFADR